VADDLSDFSKGQAFECFHCYKQAHIVIACCIVYSLFLFISASVLVYCIFYVCIFSFDATILVNKDVIWNANDNTVNINRSDDSTGKVSGFSHSSHRRRQDIRCRVGVQP